MTNIQAPNNKYNLEERTAKFGEEIIKFTKQIKKDLELTIVKPMTLNQRKIFNIK